MGGVASLSVVVAITQEQKDMVMQKIKFPQKIIDAVKELIGAYENPNTERDCPLCVACLSITEDSSITGMCSICPHTVIDGARSISRLPCNCNLQVLKLASEDPAFELKNCTDTQYQTIIRRRYYNISYESITLEEIATVRAHHIARLKRWLEVMEPED